MQKVEFVESGIGHKHNSWIGEEEEEKKKKKKGKYIEAMGTTFNSKVQICWYRNYKYAMYINILYTYLFWVPDQYTLIVT